MGSVEPCTVYIIIHGIRKVNALKHGACLEASFQPSLYCLYQSFAAISINYFVHRSLLHPRGSMHTRRAQETMWGQSCTYS